MIGKRVAHYEILEKLGEGGMGAVYKARDTHLDRSVAVKVLSERLTDASRKARFVQEAKAASALHHPDLIVVHDVASEDGADFIVMECIAGKTLDQVIPGHAECSLARVTTASMDRQHSANWTGDFLHPRPVLARVRRKKSELPLIVLGGLIDLLESTNRCEPWEISPGDIGPQRLTEAQSCRAAWANAFPATRFSMCLREGLTRPGLTGLPGYQVLGGPPGLPEPARGRLWA